MRPQIASQLTHIPRELVNIMREYYIVHVEPEHPMVTTTCENVITKYNIGDIDVSNMKLTHVDGIYDYYDGVKCVLRC